MRVGTQGLFHQYLKTFVPPFLPTRLTAPGSPRMCLIKTSLCTLYYSLVFPYLHYCASVWGSTYQSNLKRLINLQKRVIRIVSRNSFDAHANPIFVSLRILKFEDIIRLQINKVMYLCKNGLLPNSFNDIFLLNCEIHSYNTRSKNFFRLPYCRTKDPKYLIPLALKFRMPLVLLCLILN